MANMKMLMKIYRAGVIVKVISPTAFILDCSCWLCFEWATIHCKWPHGLDLKQGDWVLTIGSSDIYNYKKLYGCGNYAYYWEADVDSVRFTSREEEMKRLEEAGETDCGCYDTLRNSPDFWTLLDRC